MRRLISLISTHGKPPGQAAQEAWAAFQKYQQVEQETIQQLLSEGKITQEQALELQKQAVPSLENSSATPVVNVPEVSTEEFWNQVDKTKQELGLVTQITGYPHPRANQPVQQQVQPVEPQKKQESAIFFVNRKPEQPFQNQTTDKLIEELNKEAEREGMLAPKPPDGMQVVFFQKPPEEYKRRMLDRKKSKNEKIFANP